MTDSRIPEAPHGAPPGFIGHIFRKRFETQHAIDLVWRWLNDPATFTEGQIWPFRVEFVDGGFEPGVLNVHHGPLINLAGVIGEVRDPVEDSGGYRDLKYFYGSYALSLRLVRPARLQFWAEPAKGDSTTVTVQLDSLVREPLYGAWGLSHSNVHKC